MAQVRAVLFDLDGVLVKSEHAWFLAVEEAGRRFRGRAISREEFAPTFGQGTRADIDVFGLRVSAAELDAFYVEEFLRHLDSVWVNPEAAVLLARLEALGVARAVVTNSVGVVARALLARAGLEAFLPVLSTSDRVAQAKPAPDLVHLALAELQLAPADAVMVGDSRYDRDAAAAAGVRFLGLGLPGREAPLAALSEVLTRLGLEP